MSSGRIVLCICVNSWFCFFGLNIFFFSLLKLWSFFNRECEVNKSDDNAHSVNQRKTTQFICKIVQSIVDRIVKKKFCESTNEQANERITINYNNHSERIDTHGDVPSSEKKPNEKKDATTTEKEKKEDTNEIIKRNRLRPRNIYISELVKSSSFFFSLSSSSSSSLNRKKTHKRHRIGIKSNTFCSLTVINER